MSTLFSLEFISAIITDSLSGKGVHQTIVLRKRSHHNVMSDSSVIIMLCRTTHAASQLASQARTICNSDSGRFTEPLPDNYIIVKMSGVLLSLTDSEPVYECIILTVYHIYSTLGGGSRSHIKASTDIMFKSLHEETIKNTLCVAVHRG